MSDSYYFMKTGLVKDEQVGPVTAEQLGTLLFRKEIKPGTIAIQAGTSDWQTVEDIADVMSVVAALAAQQEQRLSDAAAQSERQRTLEAEQQRERQIATDMQRQAQVADQKRQAVVLQAQTAQREVQLTDGLSQIGEHKKRFKVLWIAEGSGKKPLYDKVQLAMSRYGDRGWTFEHMHETVWTRKEQDCCNTQEITENVMVLVFSVPAEIADKFPDLV